MPLVRTLVGIALVLVVGAMLGKMRYGSGAAQVTVRRPSAGFRMFRQDFNLTARRTFATWSVMEVIVALAGLGAALLLQLVL